MLQWETLKAYLLRPKFWKKTGHFTLSLIVMTVLVFTDISAVLVSGLPFDVPGKDKLGVEKARAEAGDIAVFRESTGGENIPNNNSVVDVTWDSTVQSNSNITLQANTSDIDLSEGGKYLVTYNTKVIEGVTTGSNRRSLNSWLTLNGTDLPYGRASNYLRDTDGLTMTYLSGGTIVDASAGDDVQLHIKRDDINPTGPSSVFDSNTNGINVIKLKDSWDYLRVFNGATTSNVHLNTSFTDVQWQNADEVDTGSFGFTATSADITLKGNDGDHFLVMANVTLYVDGTASTRQNYEMQLTLGGTPIPGTLVTAYPRGNQSGEEIHFATLSYMGIITKSAASDETLNLEMRRESTGSQVTDIARNRTALTIVALPENGNYIRLGDTSGNQTISNTVQDITWDTQFEVDTTAFSHSTVSNSDRIEIDKAGDYLFFSTVWATTTNGNNNRQPFTTTWKESGTAENRGSFWGYNRNNGTNSTGGSGSIVLPGLTTSSYVELTYEDESANAPNTSILAYDGIAVQGVLLDEDFWGTDVLVSASGTQAVEADIPTNDVYLGGQFVIQEQTSSRNVTSVTINESGSVDGANGLDNIRLYYDLDTSSPYDCASESFSGTSTESQYGSTDANGFSGADGSSSFSQTVAISTTQALCLYPVVDVAATSTDGDTIDISIDTPSTDVVATGGATIGPSATQNITGSTTLRNAELTQIHYNWRNDNGSETAATSVNGTEDSPAIGFANGTTRRLRVEVSAEGSTSSPAVQYRLEYAQKVTTCAAVSSWTDVGTGGGGDWDIVNTGNLTDGNDTTNVLLQANGGVTDENTTFLTPNGGQKDTSSQTGNITLASDEFVELEFALQPTVSAPQGNTYCFRVSDAGTALRNYDIYPEGTISADIDVSASSSQVTPLSVGVNNQYVGGTFVIERPGANRTLTSVTITEVGTVDAATDINDIRLYYDLDTTTPFDCTGESYSGTEAQFGATSSAFSAANGSSTFTGSQALNSSQAFCGYVVLDIGSGATNGETLEVEISDPSTDVVVTTSSVGPSTAVSPTGSSTISGPVLTQEHYHWRNDDGGETDATSASGGVEDTPISSVPQESIRRLRIEVSNEGLVDAQATNFRLEFGTKVSTCANIGVWTDVGAVGGAWDMALSSNIADGNTSNVPLGANGAVTDGNLTFNGVGALRETTSESGAITLTSSEFTELEYSIEATTDAGFDTDYCFRVTDSGTPLPAYDTYAELTTRQRQDYFIQRGVEVITGASTTVVAGSDYTAPAASTSAFVRITTTQITGAGNTTGGGNQNADNVTAYILDPWNIENSFVIQRPAAATGETRVTWEIIEYIGIPGGDNEMIVRQNAVISPTAGNGTATGTAATGIADDSDVVVFITGQGNDSTGTIYNTGLYTSAWSASTDQPVFSRGSTTHNTDVSYAVVEFTGANWSVQRVEHNYTSNSVTETQPISALGSLSRAFVHAQKRTFLNGLDETGHEVWLSSLGFVSFRLQNGASSPTGHYSVAWVIENSQVGTGAMNVQRSNGTLAANACGAGVEPCAETVSITSVNDENASPFVTNRSSGAGTAFPRPMVGVEIINSGDDIQYWRSDTGQTQTYRTEIVEWPVADTSVRQNYYWFYVDNDLITPTDPWPPGPTNLGENTTITGADDPLGEGERVRIRMSLLVNNASLPALTKSFKLQYGLQNTTCSAITVWNDVGAPGSGSIWRGYNGSVADGTEVATSTPASGTLLLTLSDVAGTYEEQNNSAVNPYSVDVGEDIEYDWVVEHNGAAQRSDYCFRMVNSDDTEINGYINYPTIRTTGYTPVVTDWRWYDDETNLTPTSPLAAENVAPVDIADQDIVKLRVISEEVENAVGTNIKYAIQYSEYADFSDGGIFLTSTSSCTATSTWCYADGAGVDNAIIPSNVLTNTDTCSGGTGDGCGTHNEAPTTTSTFTHAASASTEFEFTIEQNAARVNTVYYFRLYDVNQDEPLVASSSFPSLVTEGAQLVSTMTGVPSGTTLAGITSDVDTTPTSISFGSLPFGSSYEAIQELTVTTNATEGYQLLMFADQQLTDDYGNTIAPITGTNASPSNWTPAGCVASANGCFGYHTTDATLAGGSGRFAPIDSYAALETTPREIMYSSLPADDTENIIYRIQVSELQVAGDYETTITYIAVPTF